MYPQLNIDLKKLAHNAQCLTDLCHPLGISTALVTKVFCADERISSVVNASKTEYVADSRIINLMRLQSLDKPKMLLRISQLSDVARVVRFADISMQSEVRVIDALGKAAADADLSKPHKVVLMIDLGDLREGIFYENETGIMEAAEAVLRHKSLELFGVGVNLTCYGGILPDKNNLGNLVRVAEMLRSRFGVELPFVSGGNSSTIEFLKSGGVPKGITNLRFGESFVLGNDTAVCKVVDGMYGDAVTLEAELIEVQEKPSKPIGTVGRNAFGEVVEIEDKGVMRRGILAIGRQDTVEMGLYCIDENIHIIGASSDHLLVDLTNAPEYNIGSVLRFTMDYGAVLRGFTSEYVYRNYIV